MLNLKSIECHCTVKEICLTGTGDEQYSSVDELLAFRDGLPWPVQR